MLFLTLEFRHGTFSGNGVLAQSQAHGLAKAGHAVLVVSGCPDDLVVTNDATAKMQREISQPGGPDAGEVEVRTLRVPASKWGKLTAQCPWRELADAAHADEPLHERIRSFAPDVVLGIDWHVTPTWRALRRRVWRDSDARETDPNRNPGAASSSSSPPTRRSCTATTACSPATATRRTRRWSETPWRKQPPSSRCARSTPTTCARSCRPRERRWRPGWSSRP